MPKSNPTAPSVTNRERWMSDVSLREYIEALMGEREKRTSQLERDAREALDKASVALEKRLDLLNEFRAQSAEEQQKFATNIALDILRNDFETIRRDHVTRREFELVRGTQSKMIGALILVGIVLPVIVGIITHYL